MQRAKAGQGKTLSGLTKQKQMELFALGQNPEVQDFALHLRLYQSTLAACETGQMRQKRDEARDWLRYFEKSGVMELLKLNDRVPAEKIAILAESLKQLTYACHPSEVANFTTDLAATRTILEKICGSLEAKQTPLLFSDLAQTFSRISPEPVGKNRHITKRITLMKNLLLFIDHLLISRQWMSS